MSGNNFFFNGDPLLGGSNNYEAKFAELEQMQKAIEQRKQAMVQVKEQMQQHQQPAQSRTPVWDEIDSIVSNMTEKEISIIESNDEYIESQAKVVSILNSQYMKLMRPIVEESQEGKDALENHLTLVKRLRKMAASEVDKEVADFSDYKENYSDIPYSEYLKMKKQNKKPKK